MGYLNSLVYWGNYSDDVFINTTDFDSNLVPVEDVSVDAVLTAVYFNSIVFVMLMITYEILRRLWPHVYSSRKRLSVFMRSAGAYNRRYRGGSGERISEDSTTDDENTKIQYSNSQDGENAEDDENFSSTSPLPPLADLLFRQDRQPSLQEAVLPDSQPLDWIYPINSVSWTLIRKVAGLDGYFFLRYIRMCVRITAVSSFWFFLILLPVYITGSNNAMGWYHLSAANVSTNSWRMWMPVIFAYLFCAFAIFVIKQEYRHFLELRQDFLARGSEHVLPQNRYSLMVENIPYELRSDRALHEYFDKLFPGKVHSACVVLKVPELEETSRRCMRSCRRLEKSIAYFHATGMRPSHRAGQSRLSVMGLDMEPLDLDPNTFFCATPPEPLFIDVDSRTASIQATEHKPNRGVRVDSITYYTMELAEHSRNLSELQVSVRAIAESGNREKEAGSWIDQAMLGAETISNQIIKDSLEENALLAPSESYPYSDERPVEHMTSKYGSFGIVIPGQNDKRSRLLEDYLPEEPGKQGSGDSDKSEKVEAPFSKAMYNSTVRRWAGRLGLDFAVACLKLVTKQLDITVEGVIGSTMSSTGFVTFLDLSSTTCAHSASLTVKAGALLRSVAPEPRGINWQNVHISKTTQMRREQFVNVVLFVGGILWSFPLTFIQVFAKADYLAQFPGLEWIKTFHGGTLTHFVNGYLPVVALLGLISVLPAVFEQVAVRYERRKTFAEVQTSILTRYFYFQLVNVYVSVTAGSILQSLADIIDHPSNILSLLGDSLPTMVGYFVALLVTKIMAGLPMIFLRFGALFRMLILNLLARSELKVTQRELDWVYRLENVQYGWEFCTQLLVVVIVFTYAIICPIILPVGLLYFFGALVVYKKQVLYVYSPVFESGGSMFPFAVQRTLFGLVCSQMTLLGYTVTRGCYYQPAALIPLPIITVLVMRYFHNTYVTPSTKLSLERARHYDRSLHFIGAHGSTSVLKEKDFDRTSLNIEERRNAFHESTYRQPVLTEYPALPWMYRRGVEDSETVKVRKQLRRINKSSAARQAQADKKS
ncbi:hypothetical protein ACA910_021736 [Epithemia clementina (nom. ined.)]